MLTARIKIGDGDIVDTRNIFNVEGEDPKSGLVYLDSSKRIGPDLKDFESTSYPEEEGEYIIPKRVDAPFDYKVKFFIEGESLQTVNDKIVAFNQMLYTQAVGSDVKTYKQVTFYNDHKRHIIVGYPNELAEATEFWKDPSGVLKKDVVVTEWTIRVTKPSLCTFNNNI